MIEHTDRSTMSKDTDTQQVSFRLPTSLLRRLDRHTKRMKAASGGHVEVSRTDAVRSILGAALDEIERAERAAGGAS